MAKAPQLTTTAGNPIADNQNSQTAGPRGRAACRTTSSSKITHQNRERIQSVGSCKGWGAYGTLTV